MFKFDVIADSRFKQCCIDLVGWTDEIEKVLQNLPVEYQRNDTRVIVFTDNEPCISYRRRFVIRKGTRKTTWNQVFGMINAVKVCAYDRL